MSHPTATPARPAEITDGQLPGVSAPAGPVPDTAAPATAAPVVTQDLLVEEVSIDGMCGVY